MYFVVFWKEWSATIPSCWLFMESKTFKWPPKPKNPTHLCIKAILPKEDWDTIHYTRFIGPFGKFNVNLISIILFSNISIVFFILF